MKGPMRKDEEEFHVNELTMNPSNNIGVTYEVNNGPKHDAVFGNMSEDGPNYRDVGWAGTTALMLKTQIGLGVLSIPSVLDTLGMIPAIIAMLAIAIITSWSNYMVGVFKLRHPEVYGIDDVGAMIFGRFGREFMGFGFFIFWIFVSAASMLSISTALNALSTHATCTAVFVAVAAVFGFCFSSIRTLAKISWLAWLGVTCIIVSRSSFRAPQTGPWQADYQMFKNPSFADAVSACSTLVFAYAGTPGFFPIAAEMRDPRLYTRSLVICQSVITVIYVTVGIVVYYYCGSFVASPALGSAGTTLKMVCYGIALPGLCVTTILISHLPAKFLFVRLLRGSEHLTNGSMRHWATWLGSTGTVCLSAYIIASAIPIFGGLISLIGAIFGTLFCFQPMGAMWLYDNWTTDKSLRTRGWWAGVSWSFFVILVGTFLLIAGTYGSVVGIIASFAADGGTQPWSCADNSGSV